MRDVKGKQQYITIPPHKPLKIGTLNNILREVAQQLKMSKNALLSQPFGKLRASFDAAKSSKIASPRGLYTLIDMMSADFGVGRYRVESSTNC